MIFRLAIFGSFTGETGKAVEVYAPHDANFFLQLTDRQAKGFFWQRVLPPSLEVYALREQTKILFNPFAI